MNDEGAGPADDDAPPPAGTQLAGLLVLGAIVGTINGLSRVTMPVFAAALGAAAWQVGLVGGLGYAGMLTMALPMGAWVDRHGTRLLFARGVLIAAALYGVLTFVTRPWQAVIGAAVLGLVLPFRVIPAHTEFLALLPRLSASKAGWNRGANTVGMFFVGPAVGAAVIASLGFAPVFALAAAGLLVAFLVGQRVLRGPLHGDGRPPGDLPILQRIRGQLRLVAGHAELRRTMAVDFLTQMTVAYFVVFAIIQATRRFHLPLQTAAGLVSLQGATYVVVLMIGGGWVMRRHEEQRYLLAFMLLALQGLLCAFGPAPWAMWIAAALMGLGMGLQGLTSTQRFAELLQQFGRGRISGLGSIGPPAGGVLGSVVGGLVSQAWGTEAGFGLLAAAYLALLPGQWRRWRWAERPA